MQTIEPQQIAQAEATIPATPVRSDRLVVTGWAIGLSWALAYVVIGAVAPETDPEAPLSALDLVLSNLLLVGMMLTVGGLTTRSNLAGAGAVLGGGVFAVGSVTCWATGHVGTWIAVQFAAGLALGLIGAISLLSRRR